MAKISKEEALQQLQDFDRQNGFDSSTLSQDNAVNNEERDYSAALQTLKQFDKDSGFNSNRLYTGGQNVKNVYANAVQDYFNTNNTNINNNTNKVLSKKERALEDYGKLSREQRDILNKREDRNVFEKAFDKLNSTVGAQLQKNAYIAAGDYQGAKSVDADIMKNNKHYQALKASGMSDADIAYYLDGNNYETMKQYADTDRYEKKRQAAVDKLDSDTYNLLNQYNKQEQVGTSFSLTTSGPSKAQTDELSKSAKTRDEIIKKTGWSLDEFNKNAQYVRELENKKTNENNVRQAQDAAKDSVIGSIAANAMTVPTNAVAPLLAGMEKIKSFGYADKDAPVDTNSYLYQPQTISDTIRSTTAEELGNATNSKALNEIMKLGYQGTMAAADSTFMVAGLTAGLTELGVGAEAAQHMASGLVDADFFMSGYTKGIKQANDEGLSGKNAERFALAQGVNEALSEIVSLDLLAGMFAKGGKTALVDGIKQIAMQAGIEGSEEVFGDVLNDVADNLINNDFSNFNQSVFEYKQAGKTEEEARSQAYKDKAKEYAEDFVSGAISGGLGAGSAHVQNRMAWSDIGNKVKDDTELLKKVAEVAKNNETLNDTTAKEIFEKTESVENLSKDQVGRAIQSMQEVASEEMKDVFASELESKGVEKNNAAEIASEMIELVDGSKNKLASVAKDNKNEVNEVLNDFVDGKLNNQLEVNSTIREVSNALSQAEYNKQAEEYRKSEKYVADSAEMKTASLAPAKLDNIDVKVKGIASTGENARVKLDNGKTESLDKVQIDSPKLAEFYRIASNMENERLANSMIEYASGIPAATMAEAGQLFYDAGKLDLGYENVLNNSKNARIVALFKNSNEEAFLKQVYMQGQNVSEEKKPAKKANTSALKKNAKFKNESSEKFSEEQEGFFNALARLIKNDITVKDFIQDENTKHILAGVLGQHKTGEIELSTQASNNTNLVVTVFHEAMENLEVANPQAYKDLKKEVMAVLQSKMGIETLDGLIKKYQKTYQKAEGSKTLEDAANEMFNDIIGQMFTTDYGLEAIVNETLNDSELSAPRKQGVLESIKDIASRMIKAIKKLMKGEGQAAWVHNYISEKEAKAIVDKALAAFKGVEPSGLIKNDESKAKHSINVDEALANDFDFDILGEWMTGENDSAEAIEEAEHYGMGYDFVKMGNKKLGYTEERISKLLDAYAASNPDYAQAYITYMSPIDFLNLTTGFENRSMKYIEDTSHEINLEELKEETQPIFLDIDTGSEEVIGHEGRHRMYALYKAGFNSVPVLLFDYSNKYSKEYQKYMELMPQYFDDEDDNFSETDRILATDIMPFSRGNEKIIRDLYGERSKADARFSLDVDSEGRKLTKGQQDFFAKSQARDEQGRLKVYYHGTETADFTVFDPEYAADSISLFFTDSETVAKGYSGTTEKVKLNYNLDDLNKMVDADESIVKVGDAYQLQEYDAARDKTNVTFEGSYEEMKDYVLDMYGTIGSGNYEVYLNAENPLIVDADKNYWDELPHNDETWTTREYAEYAKENGYDSLIVNNVIDTAVYASNMEKFEISQIVVVFNSNQVKSVDNEHPTDNEDIRYSVDVDSEGRKLTEAQKKFFSNSKVVDEEGRLKVVYHGTMNNFTVFDLQEARDAVDIEAFFFSGDYDESNGYGNVGEYYLNITNPADYDTAYGVFFKHKGESHAGRLAREELQAMGYDGVIAVDEDSPEYTEYLAFNSNQIKRTDNLEPSENEDVRYSLDVEYETAYKNSDVAKMEELVTEAARAAGYDSPKLYHGTSRFGFTKFDLEKMDDKATIFLTSNPNIASTYSGTAQQKKISEGFTKDPMTVPVTELADELNNNLPDDGVDRHYEYYDKKKVDALNKQNEQALNEIMSLIQQIEAMPDYVNMKIAKTVEQVKTNLYLYTAKELLQNRERNKAFGSQLWTIAQSAAAKDIDTFIKERIGQIEQDIRKAFILNNEMQDEAILEDSLDGYVFEVYSPSEARAFLRKQAGQGIYSLYGKLGKTMVIDGAGRNWNALEKQWVKAYTSQFNTDNTELIREDGRIALYSQEGDLLRDMQENEFTDVYSDDQLKQHLIDGLDYIYGIKRGDIQTTRDIVKFAKQHGYDSVLFKNIRDNGGRNHKVDFDELADVYAIFNSEDVKSADAVTYDDKGDVIPLSERFDESKDELRYSIEVVEGDSGKIYKNCIVLNTPIFDNIPKRKWNKVLYDFVYNSLAGKEIVVYDKNGNEEILSIARANDRVKKDGAKNSHKVIDKITNYRGFEPKARMIAQIMDIAEHSFYSENNDEHTHQWMDEKGWEFRDAYILDVNGIIYKGRLNIAKGKNRNIIYEIWPIKEVDRGKVALSPYGDAPSLNVDSNNKITPLKENSNNINETGYSLAVDSEGNNLSAGQVKSIYNENPTENDDIRYSLSVDTDDVWMEIAEAAAPEYVTKTSEIIEEGNRLLQSGEVKVTANDCKRVAAEIIDKYQSNANQAELAENIRKVFAYAKEYSIAPKDFAAIMQSIAMPVVNELKFVDNSMEAEYKSFKQFFKGMKIKLDAPQKAEVASMFDSYTNFRREMQKYGIILNLNVGTSLDDVWSEIVEASGNRLSEAENSANQPLALLEYLRDIEDRAIVKSFEKSAKDAPVYEGATKEEAAYGVAMDIIGSYYKYVAGEKLETDEATKYIKLNNDLKTLATKEKARSEREFKKRVERATQEELGKKLAMIMHIENEIAEAKSARGEAIESRDELAKLAYEQIIMTDTEKLAALRKQKNDEIAKIKAKYKSSKEYERARRKNSELKKKVERNYNTLSSMVANPTETKHIPFGAGTENMVNAVIDVLELINLNNGNGSRTFADKMARLQDKYDALKDSAGFDYDANTAKMINELKSAVLEEFEGSPKMIRQLRDDELQTIINITNQLITQIRNENRLINNKKTQDAYEASNGIIEETKQSRIRRNPMTELAEKILGTKTVAKANDALNKYFTWHLNAERWFNKVSGYKKDSYWKSIYQSLDDGQMKMLNIERDINKIFEDVLEGKANQAEIKKLHSTKPEDMVDIGLRDEKGNPVMVTKAMRLSLIMHSYNDDNLRHVLGDGLTVPDMELYEKGKVTDAYNNGKTYRYVPYDDYLMAYKTKGDYRQQALRHLESQITSAKEYIQSLEKSDDFTDYEKRFLRDAKKMFHEYTGGVINDTSQVLKGYKIARVNNYFPIKSDPNFTKQDYAGLIRDGSIEGMGFLKNRVVSKNPILLEDITNVILRQTKNTALYGGLAIPIRNLNMVLNINSHDFEGYNQSVKSALAQTWGETDNKFLRDLITDLQLGRHQDPTIFDSLRGKFAGATLTLNLGVAIKQAASYPTAAAVLGWKPLGKAFADFNKGFIKAQGLEELEKRNPLLWKRSQGYSTQELGDIKDNRGWGEKLTSKIPGANMIQFVDTGTVRTLEYASKYYVDENYKNLEEGSDEYWDKVSEVFTQVVQRTQPNYTTLQRPDMLRTPNQLIKQLAMFKTQPLQNFGIMYDALAEYGARVSDERIEKTEEATKARKAAGVNLAKAVSSQIVAAAVFSMMTIAADMIYHKQYKYAPDDDEDETMLEKMLTSFFKGIGSTFSGMLFLGDTLFSALSYWLTGDTYYGLEVSVTGMINDVVDGVAKLQSSVNKLTEANTDEEAEKAQKKVMQQIKKIFTTAGEFVGIPANNIIKTIDSIVLYGEDIVTGSAPGTSEEWIYSDTKTMKDRYLDAYSEGDSKEMNSLKDQIAEDKGKTEEEAQKYVNNWITSEEWKDIEKEVNKSLNSTSGSNKVVVQSVMDIYNAKKAASDAKTAKSSVASSITSKYKNTYLELLKTDKTKAARLQNILISMYMAIGYNKDDALKKIKKWSN